MVGNATEEALLRDLKHPSHRDRPVWPLGLAVAVAVVFGVVLDLLSPFGLSVWAEALVAAIVIVPICVVVVYVFRQWSGRPGTGRADDAIDARAAYEAGLARRIAEARARGDFGRWEVGPRRQQGE